MGPTSNTIPAWVTFLVERIIAPVARHFNNQIGELEKQNAKLTGRVWELENRWDAFAKTLQPPNVVTGNEVGPALIKFANNLKPRPDPLTIPTDTPHSLDPPGA